MTSIYQPLSTWDQAAPRAYIRQVHCFAYNQPDECLLEPLRQNLRAALDRTAKLWPKFAGRVVLQHGSAGKVSVAKSPGDEITLRVLDDRDSFGWDYEHLKSAGFPAQPFVGPSFALPQALDEDGPGLAATVIHARVIRGGLLLCTFCHHVLVDGMGMNKFLSAFAAYTRELNEGHVIDSESYMNAHIDVPADLGSALIKKYTFEDLVQQCPEYHVLAEPSGPLTFRSSPNNPSLESVPKTGRLFVLEAKALQLLKSAVCRPRNDGIVASNGTYQPSTFACLAALTWAHSTSARLRASSANCSTQEGRQSNGYGEEIFRLVLPASWARRAFTDLADQYVGNAVGMVEITTDVHTILAAAQWSPETTSDAKKAFASLVSSIETALAGIDEDFVTTRTAMMRAAPDPRLIGSNVDPQDPRDFMFNSWRHFGADVAWGMPGIGGQDVAPKAGTRADAVRRTQSDWNLGAGLIMPGSKESTSYEMIVTLEVSSMEELCRDSCWGGWLRDVVN
ncbi:hypothetical protein HIM_07582 [Hirsutella minnesotensis 3608]|uniref:Trichothecene 3-O-acetyltransferase-like N-terminal domain-containing protein n=1 Tax=Hirsutella minnesotensis 3608 TaxID=1043627 RepID=A0A0F7ZN25_9HYPO|nr:hypothetical protein HIM_07582 [Hirsutella minnesotensis 3608]